jgi:hypothetical protein
MGLFGKNIREGIEEVNLTKYTIGLMLLEKIPLINKDYLSIDVFDLTVTTLKIPSKTKYKTETIKGKKVRKTIITPDIVFYLHYDNENISLTECLLPNQCVIASKAEIVENQSEKRSVDGTEYYIKVVFNLIVFTRRSLIQTTQTYEDYQNEITQIKSVHKEELDEMRESYEERMENRLVPYKKNEENLRKKIEERDEQILDLISSIPNRMNEKIYKLVRKLNNTDETDKAIEKPTI